MMSKIERQANRLKRLRAEDVRGFTDEQLMDLRNIYADESVRLANQLDTIEANVKERRQYAKPELYAEIKGAKRNIGQSSQIIQTELGRRRRSREEKGMQHTHDVSSTSIIAAMNQLLDRDVVDQIIELAQHKHTVNSG